MVTIDGFPLDLVEKIDHSLEVQITDYPVEGQVDGSDHARLKPRPLVLTNGVVSNTPTGAIALDPSRRGGNTFGLNAYRFLEQLAENPRTVVVVTDLKRYESMLLEKLDVSEEAKTRGALVFTARFRQVLVKRNARVTVLLPNTGGVADVGPGGIHTLDGTHILWSKGKPPGTSPTTKPPGVIVGQEVLSLKGKKVIHQDGKTPLTDEEIAALRLDLARDERAKEDAAFRADPHLRDQKREEIRKNRTDAALRILDGSKRTAEAPDPAVMKARGAAPGAVIPRHFPSTTPLTDGQPLEAPDPGAGGH